MSDINLNDLLNQMGQQYPDWVNKAVGNDIRALEKAITAMSKNIAIGNKEAIRADKDKKKRDKELKDSVNKGADKLAKAQERYAKAQADYAKKMEAAKESFLTGDARGAMENFKSGLKSGVTGLGKLGTALNVGSIAVGALVGVSQDLYNEMYKSKKSYSDITNAGIMVAGGFMGLRKAAVDGRQSVEDLTAAMQQSTSAIASMGVEGAAKFAAMSKKLNEVDTVATKFGMNLTDINKYLIDYLDNQKVIGTLNRMTEKQNEMAINKSISQLSAFAGILGKSREQIIKDSQQMFKDPNMRNIMMRTMQADNITGDRATQVRQNTNMLSQAFNSMMNAETAEKLMGAAYSKYARSRGVVDYDVGRTQESVMLETMAPEAIGKLTNLIGRLNEGEISTDEFNKLYIDMATTLKKEFSSQSQITQGILLNTQEAHGGLKAMQEAAMDFEQSIIGIVDLEKHLTNTFKESTKIADSQTDSALAMTKTVENVENAAKAFQSGLFNATVETKAFTAAISAATGVVDSFLNRDKAQARIKAVGDQRISDIQTLTTSKDATVSTAAQKALSEKASLEEKIAALKSKQYGPDEEHKRRIDQLEIDNLQRQITRTIISAPKLAEGGVANKRMLAEIAEAGSPEMVMPLDPSLHNMAKYNAEMMVDIYGPFQRQLLKSFKDTVIKDNEANFDMVFTKILGRFFFSKSDVSSELNNINAGVRGTEATRALMNTMGYSVSASSAARYQTGQSNDNAYNAAINSTTGLTMNHREAMDYLINEKKLDPKDAAAIVGNLEVESPGLNPGAIGDGGKAYGIGQWHPDRQARFEQKYNKSIRGSSVKEQLDFIVHELENQEDKAYRHLKQADTVENKAAAFDQFYERSSGQHRAKRVGNARRFFDSYNSPESSSGVSGGKFLGLSGNARGYDKIDPRLRHVIEETAKESPYGVKVISAFRDNSPNHRGKALDIQLVGPDGKDIPHAYLSKGGNGSFKGKTENFALYEEFAQAARKKQMELYPNMPFRWGGGFGGKMGAQYGANDDMHFDVTGGAMGAYSWQNGLNSEYRGYFDAGNPASRGMGANQGGFSPTWTAYKRRYGNYVNDKNPRLSFAPENQSTNSSVANQETVATSNGTGGFTDGVSAQLDKLNRSIEELARAYRKGNGVLAP